MNDADFNTIISQPPIAVPKEGGARDLADIPTVKLEALQKRYVNRMKLKQDNETMAKMQAVGYELGLRIVLAEIRKDVAALGEH
jgi:hypothetical protein